jgi:tetratricopeptide (TPR) repeat protein
MKNLIVTGLFLLAQYAAFAQQSVLNGTVTVFNSQFETGKKQYVDNAQVEEDYGKSQATTTNTEGAFKLPLVGIKDLDKVFFNVKKANYEVVNTDALQAVAGQKEAVQVYMAQEGVLAENKRKYYQINRTASEKAVTEKLVQLGQQIETLQQNKEANKSKIEVLQAEYARLQDNFKKIEETARELAERYAKTNLDDASAEYQRAFRYFQRGLLDSALFVFQKMDLEQTAQFVVSEQNRTAALKIEYETRNTEKNKQKVQTTEALLFKANLHQTKFEFSRVEECYDLLLRLDSTNVNTLWNYAYFLAKQRQDKKAIDLYKKVLSLSKSDELKATFQNNLGNLYSNIQRMPQAEDAYIEALKLYRALANKSPDVFLPDVAKILNNLGIYYFDNQKMPQAEAAYTEALNIRRTFAIKKPEAFLPDLANTLNNLGTYYSESQKMSEAEVVFVEALKIRRTLADKNPNVFLPDVAMTLNNLGNYYIDTRKMPQAETAYTEALDIRRKLSDKNPNEFLPDVARTMNNLAIYYNENQKLSKAEDMFIETLKLYQTLANKNPDAFLPYVAGLLNNLGVFQKTFGNYKQALIHFSEAMIIQENAILAGDVNQFRGWETTMGNISDIIDSAPDKKEYVNLVKSLQLLSESCYKLKDINENLLLPTVKGFGSLSYWTLFIRDYELAEKSALRCLELDKTQEFAYSNLGHSQLLRGQYTAAKTTYEQLKGKKDKEGKHYKQIILDDFKALEAEGITHKDMPRMKAEIEKW